MVLPLWPGETDMHSQQKARSFVPPEIPEEEKRYLVVYYKTRPTITEEEIVRGGGKQKQKQKEREKESESTPGSDQAKNIMLSSFIVVALTVSFEELQDLRVTLPKEGLMVTGPLEDAFRSIPPKTARDSSSDVSVRECVLAQCNSRDTGLQFDPEALIQLGLCSVVRETGKEPLPLGRVSEEFDSQKTIEVKLTSLGTAVMEMIWYGGLALTSFGAE
ncbi:hypothetical protein K435DRAFT_663830 [Dendrothele bispora CBS 962.96]|uniref:Uncharacterized protein n=1 Tax=Dendrothele bispora (strain CBS 962.96) TaxID=1314807 RepID=A0A4S8M3J3_DENBC|nr:hypothetical protein K435DRAFT_663830 [Dendrothele bispora CBS 962.96]